MIKKLLNRLTEFEKMIFISMSFTVAMVVLRFLYTDDRQYFFYPWNLFLATVPLFFSRQLKSYKKNQSYVVHAVAWLAIILTQCTVHYYRYFLPRGEAAYSLLV